MIKILLDGTAGTVEYIGAYGKPTGLWKVRQVEMQSD